MVQEKPALSGIPVERAMMNDFQTAAPTDSRAVDVLLAGAQQDFPVLDGFPHR